MSSVFKVSVIIPVYNAAQFIRTAVNSAIKLNETGEVILIDDGSVDDSLEICLQLANEFDNLVVLQHNDKCNHGVSATRNLGIHNAKFDFVAFLDVDDYYLPNRFLKDKEILMSNSDVDGVYNALGIHYYSEKGKQKFINAGYKYQEFYTLSGNVPSNELFFVLFNAHSSVTGEFHGDTITVRKNIFEKSGNFPINLKLKEDTHLWRRMAAKCTLVPGDIFEPVAIRGVHDNNTMVNKAIQPKANKIWWNDLHKWLINNNVNSDYVECFDGAYLYYKLNNQSFLLSLWAFIVFFFKYPHHIKIKYGRFDICFFKLFGKNWFSVHLISFKNHMNKA